MVKSVLKALEILELFCNGHHELTISEMAELTNIEKTAIYRISSTLAKKGYLTQRKKRGKYSLGTVFFEFSGVLKRNFYLRDIAIPYLNELAQQVRESAVLGIWSEQEEIVTETFHFTPKTDSPLKVIPDEGISLPLHCSAIGKIFMAEMSDEEIDIYCKNKILKKFTDKTIVDLNKLKEHLHMVRKKKVASENDEFSMGVTSIASGIRDYRNVLVASLSVIAPSVRLNENKIATITKAVRTFSLKISKDLGCPFY